MIPDNRDRDLNVTARVMRPGGDSRTGGRLWIEANMSPLEWDGRHLGGDSLALTIPTVVTAPDGAPPLILAASTGDRRCIIPPERIGEFLRVHGEALVVCHDAGPFFWAIADHLSRSSDRAALEIFWGFPRAGRLHDIILLDQLVRMATGSARPRAESFQELSVRHLRIELAVEEQRPEAAVQRAEAALALYRVL